VEALAAQIDGYAAAARPVRQLVALLTERPYRLDGLVRATALPRRTVESVLAALRPDLVEESGAVRIRTELAQAYRDRFGYAQLAHTALADPLSGRLTESADLLADAERLVAGAPGPLPALDHVPATPETVVRRALWLDSRYDLAGAHLLCLGDHDLTSVLVAQVNPAVTITVVDLDERVLAYLDEAAAARGIRLRCLVGDLRFGLPPLARGRADLVFTDPPYTPDGVRLFLARGVQGLRDRQHGRLVMAYGYSERHPSLGWQVQQAAAGLGLAFEAILPGFNRYLGAQAVGSASDLYVCRPVGRSDQAAALAPAGIYTHGPQSAEATVVRADEAAVRELTRLAGEGATLVAPAGTGAPVRLDTVLASGLPAGLERDGAVAVDLSADPGAWLLRTLLAANAARLALLVPNAHPDVSSQRGQQGLADLVRAKYRLSFQRNTPDPSSTVVLADRVAPPADPAATLRSHVLHRAHGKLGNVWRAGLGASRERVASSASRPDLLDASLVELPRHTLTALLADLESSAR
jgi:predicted methyltransferase